MLNYDRVIDNSNAFKIIELDMQNNRCSHAYLFVSADENYANRFAERVAELFASSNVDENLNFRIEKRVHPDIKFFGEEKAVDVATVSSIIEQSGISPFEADKKIFVINKSGEMGESAQNKILKTIEEPTKETYFLLVANNITRILPTIMSRVKMINLDELKVDEISSMLIESGISKEKAEIFASCSNQNGTFAEKLATDSGFIDFFNNIVSCFFEINRSRDVLKFSSLFTPKPVDKEEFVNICLLILRDLNMIIVNKSELVTLKICLSKLKVIASMLTLEAISMLIEYCLSAKEKLHFNVNQTAVVDGILFKIAEVKVRCKRQ